MHQWKKAFYLPYCVIWCWWLCQTIVYDWNLGYVVHSIDVNSFKVTCISVQLRNVRQFDISTKYSVIDVDTFTFCIFNLIQIAATQNECEFNDNLNICLFFNWLIFKFKEQNIPIDIHIGKLLEWLVSRHIVAKNWHTRIPEVRNKISHAINDMPAHEQLVKLLSGTRKHHYTFPRELCDFIQRDPSPLHFQIFTTFTVCKSLTFWRPPKPIRKLYSVVMAVNAWKIG